MNKKKLILTSTVNMNREKWLAFRSPLKHAYDALDGWGIERNYEALVRLFSGNSQISEDWQALHLPTLGASEVSTVLGLNQYKSIIELFYEKVGVKETVDFDNIYTFWGKELEEQIADKWQYWSGNAEEMIANFKKGNIIRRCRKINFYVQNIETPWLFCSLDRVINKIGNIPEGSLECKTISGWAADKWENGIPPDYVVQLQSQLLSTEFIHGELAILKDGRTFDVLPFERMETICNAIHEKTRDFATIVKKAIEHFICSQYATEEKAQQHFAAIDALSPEPDGSKSYENYLKVNHSDKGGILQGNDETYTWAKEYNENGIKVSEYETKQREYSNKLKAFIGNNNVIDFGVLGRVTWKADINGKRSFRVLIK